MATDTLKNTVVEKAEDLVAKFCVALTGSIGDQVSIDCGTELSALAEALENLRNEPSHPRK